MPQRVLVKRVGRPHGHRDPYPVGKIAAWCAAKGLDESCCPQAVKQVFKPTRLSSNGFFPTKAKREQWEHDARPVITTVETCTDTGGYHMCATTIEVDDAAMTLVQQKITQCKDSEVHTENRARCTDMQLGHCCNAIDSTERMTPEQIIDTTKQCALDAYPCQLVKAVHGTKHEVDLEQAQRKCAASRVAAARKTSFEHQMEHRARSMCQEGIVDWVDTNKGAYDCCVSTAYAHARVHGHLPQFKDLSSKCHPKDYIDREEYKFNRWMRML